VTSRIIKVGLLTAYLREKIESDDMLQDVWVEGEISSYSVPGSGHAYFSIKDDRSILSCIMWRSARSRQSYQPVVGDQVVIHGSVTVYEAQGKYQLSADVVHPAGAGVIQLRLVQLRQQLEAEGLFDPSRKRTLPAYPARIGVVTSSTGAVWRDIQQVIGSRYPLVELVLAPAIVQGDQAPQSIIRSLIALQAAAGIEFIIVARGGGSGEDLSCFNDERVVRAIFSSRLPVVSAVGHETDTTIADYVADVRAPTPSAAAAMVVPDIADLAEDILSLRTRSNRAVSAGVGSLRAELLHVQHRLFQVSPVMQLGRTRSDLAATIVQLRALSNRRLERLDHDLDRTSSVLRALNPHAMLSRGYAFVEDGVSGAPIRGIRFLRNGERIRANFADGYANASITDVVESDSTMR